MWHSHSGKSKMTAAEARRARGKVARKQSRAIMSCRQGLFRGFITIVSTVTLNEMGSHYRDLKSVM